MVVVMVMVWDSRFGRTNSYAPMHALNIAELLRSPLMAVPAAMMDINVCCAG